MSGIHNPARFEYTDRETSFALDGAMTEVTNIVVEYLNRNIATVPILLFLIGMLFGIIVTWAVMRR